MHQASFSFVALTCLLLSAEEVSAQLAPITDVTATPYDHHIEINWAGPAGASTTSVLVYGSTDGGNYTELANYGTTSTTHIAFLGDWGVTGSYYLRPVDEAGRPGAPSDTVSATTFEMSDFMLLDMVQQYTLRYFDEFGHPVSGLARERNATPDIVTSGGSGFGVMALIVGAERGFIPYDRALARTNKMVDYLLEVPRFKGAFAHWMHGADRTVIPFSPRDDGGDLVETAFLIQGLLTARQFYTGSSEAETRLRANITRLWEEVDWNWYRQSAGDVIYWHWSPNNQFAINLPVRGFNEAQIVYVLAVASPTAAFDVPPSLYRTGWAGGNYASDDTYYGFPLIVGRGKGGPLFFSHYSNLGLDPRGRRDAYANYFERNRNHSLINYKHCVDNPYGRAGYSESVWGLTASDDPDGYKAHSPSNAGDDNGTITPAAALGSMPYIPVESMRALKHFYRELGDKTWGPYGFYDAFNIGRGWYADSYLAIDQGPIVCMIENARSGLLWNLFMENPEIAPALEAVGFVEDSTSTAVELPPVFTVAPSIRPNPVASRFTLDLPLRAATEVTVELFSGALSRVQTLYRGHLEGGANAVPLTLHPRQRPGYYLIKITTPEGSATLPLILQP